MTAQCSCGVLQRVVRERRRHWGVSEEAILNVSHGGGARRPRIVSDMSDGTGTGGTDIWDMEDSDDDDPFA